MANTHELNDMRRPEAAWRFLADDDGMVQLLASEGFSDDVSSTGSGTGLVHGVFAVLGGGGLLLGVGNVWQSSRTITGSREPRGHFRQRCRSFSRAPLSTECCLS